MRHPYLIHLDDPNDWLTVNKDIDPNTNEVIEEQHDILWPEGPDQMYEFNDSHFYLSTSYHEHNTGWETFFIHEGKMDLYINGRVSTAEAGDVIFIPPYTAHKMVMQTPKVIWNGMFHGIGMLTTLNNWALILKTNPEMLNDPEVQANYLGNKNNILRENPPYAERVEKAELTNIRTYDKPKALYTLPGITMRQYTDRAENNGKTELWLAELKAGVEVKYKKVNSNVDMFYVIEGEVEFNVANEIFVAGPRSLVKIPHYAPRSFKTLTDVKMYDAGGSTHWLDLLVDMKSLKMLNPEKYADGEYVKGVFSRHECYVEYAAYGDTVIYKA